MDKKLKENVIQTSPITEETVSPAQFIKINKEQKDNIKDSRIVPPKLGDSHFGKIHIDYNYPVYRVLEY